jgi:hypothetical protein
MECVEIFQKPLRRAIISLTHVLEVTAVDHSESLGSLKVMKRFMAE